MNLMSYKEFQWPNNPGKLSCQYKRDALYGQNAQGQWVYLGLGEPHGTIQGSGSFTGPDAYDLCRQLQEIFTESTAGSLYLPDGSHADAYFTELTVRQDPRVLYAEYDITFRLADAAGGLPKE